MSDQDKRLIEDYLPIVAISAEASREKNVRKGHISTLHLWWARRPLVACRAAVYGALVPASRFVPNNGSAAKKKSLGRANAAKFVTSLCKYPGDPKVIAEAQRHILESHAERLTHETGKTVTVEDIEDGRAPRPKVLDMFAGGGAIPLEALRLGCEAYALDLNPVAHIIQLCTLVYPQKYGKPDPTARGMTGPTNAKNESTWGGLAKEVRYWGQWVLKKVKAEIGDLYPLIPDPAYKKKREPLKDIFGTEEEVPPGYLMPVAYLWTRTVTCKNATCKATVPLLRQTWLCKKKDRYVALRMIPVPGAKQASFAVVDDDGEQRPEDVEWLKELKGKKKQIKASEERELLAVRHFGFDPEDFSKGGIQHAHSVKDRTGVRNVKERGNEVPSGIGVQQTAVVCIRSKAKGKVYLAADELSPELLPDDDTCRRRIVELCKRTGLTVPNEPMPKPGTLGFRIQPYGIKTWGDLFTSRQLLCLLTFAAAVRSAHQAMTFLHPDIAKAVATMLACIVDKQADFNSSLCVLKPDGGRGIVHTFGRHALPMVWDFAEANPFNQDIASWASSEAEVFNNIATLSEGLFGTPIRASAMAQPWPDGSIDAVITDPPYYDNVPYADISDFFYIWLKRMIGDLYSEHFSGQLTPKKQEAIADPSRHGGSKQKANNAYEQMMADSLAEAHRVLKPGGSLVVVYAHKTTLGWSTLVDALRFAGFTVLRKPGRSIRKRSPAGFDAQNSSALASSIFLVGRKREGTATGSYETDVQPELEAIVRERVETLWDQGISGADLVIACVGAGLRAFTRFARVEYANGDEVPAERFLLEVETVVLDSILGRLSKEVGGKGTSLAGVDPATRFYTLWRYTYRAAELDAGEAIIFANGTHVELDGPNGLSSGARALVEKKKGKYRLLDFAERGDDDDLGQPTCRRAGPSRWSTYCTSCAVADGTPATRACHVPPRDRTES